MLVLGLASCLRTRLQMECDSEALGDVVLTSTWVILTNKPHAVRRSHSELWKVPSCGL